MSNETKNTDCLIDVHIEEQRWCDYFPDLEKWAEDVFTKTVAEVSPHLKAYQACLVLSDNQAIQELNHTYRNKNQPTNVLAFPASMDMGVKLPFELLGDVIIAFETVKQQAQEQGKTMKNHTAHLIVHGALHLLGYDHIKPEEAEEMEALEVRILAEMGVNNPYEDDNVSPII